MKRETFSSIDPATGEPVWTGPAADATAVDGAVGRARRAWPEWSRRPMPEREDCLRAFARVLATASGAGIADAISREIGKPPWEAAAEVQSMITKVDFAVRGHAQRCAEFSGGPAITRFRPHGVCAVFGPFNFPGHLPNGHIVPALLAGNTVIFKPSEQAPLVAERTLAAWHEAGLPQGVLEVVQGGRATGAALATHAGIDGLFFTGSARAGQWLSEQFARTPEKILALEMGGNNPLVVWDPRDQHAAALIVVQSAYLTAGQRCTCARRLIVADDAKGAALVQAVVALAKRLRVGPPTARPEPFMGPVISARAAADILATQQAWRDTGGAVLLESRRLLENTGLISPGLVDVTAMASRPPDEEVFGPLLQLIRVKDFASALAEANATQYGLAAGLVSDDRMRFEAFRETVRAGVINWNQQLTGASGAVPFGGIKRSGNHRPSGWFAADYCSYAVAGIEVPEVKLPDKLPMGIEP
jgi:succinylglutamic semialdehyde dehydrogenase